MLKRCCALERRIGLEKKNILRCIPSCRELYSPSFVALFTILQKNPRFYPAEDPIVYKSVRVVAQNAPRVRKSITPGCVLIILAGRFRGKRVVCLKALESGLLLVSGPYKINGVPLRRVNQAYVIATSTKVDVSKVDVSSITDDYFSRAKDDKKEGEGEFFAGDAPKAAVVSDQRKADQAKVDAALLKVVGSVDMLEGYLAAHFSLTSSCKPHKMQW
jgi:large subunit ribosomal protein L6e